MTEKDWARSQIETVEASRPERMNSVPPEMGPDEQEDLLHSWHPDYKGARRGLRVGVSRGGEELPIELADLLEADSPLPADYVPQAGIETDVLILGGGGAGVSAALALETAGLKVHLATKLRVGDANTVMAEGGIQAAVGPEDSPQRHFADAYVGGHGKNDAELLRYLCTRGRPSIQWLTDLGCQFDRNADGTYRLRSGGGTSVPRVLACRDYTGLEIMRVLRDELSLGSTKILPYHSAVELLDNGEGQVTGAVLWSDKSKKLVTVSARAVLLATGGSGRLHVEGFPTSNHVGATGDGLVLAYRQACQLVHAHTFQYHPAGSCYPEALTGQLVTEAVRSAGAQLVNAKGNRFVDEISTRDVVASAILREIAEGRGIETPAGRKGVWLDTPMIDRINGPGTLREQFPGIIHRFERYDIDPVQQPLLIAPTLHYQNGGIKIDDQCRTERQGLWAAGEVAGGLHGTNRLMGNSLLDIVVFGRHAAECIRQSLPERGNLTLAALTRFRKERETLGLNSENLAPILFPKEMNRNFDLSAGPADSSTGMTSPTGGSGGYEPPDPFANRF